MNSLIESLNAGGIRFLDFAGPLLWQSSVVIAFVFGFDFFFRRKLRPAVRYALWFVVFVKLIVPPTLALPTGAAWWLRPHQVPPPARNTALKVTYGNAVAAFVPPATAAAPAPRPSPKLSRDAWILLGSAAVSCFLLAWSVFHWRHIARRIRDTRAPDESMLELLEEVRRQAGVRGKVIFRVTSEAMSPAVCGLVRPVVLLPQALIEKLSARQLRAVLLHELIHLRRQDVWVNCAQTLLQIFYWWHPLLWFVNARVRRLREEAVDDAVMVALSDEAEIYAPTLLEVAKLAFHRPLASLGLVGILESRNALRHRIERLLNFAAPRRAGLSVMSLAGIVAFSAVAVPMGEPPVHISGVADSAENANLRTYHAKVDPKVFIRKLKARATETMHTPADDWNDILVSILESFGVDCSPPRGITLNTRTGELTTQNSSEALKVVDEVIRELNLPGDERSLNPPYLKQVVINAEFYQMRSGDFEGLNLEASPGHHAADSSPWWDLSPVQFSDVRQHLKSLGLQPLSSPQIQTSHAVAAQLHIGNGTNYTELECLPFVREHFINLTTLARTSGECAPNGKDWLELAGRTNCAIFARMDFPDGDGVVMRAESTGMAGDGRELILLLRAQTVEPAATISNKVAAAGAGENVTTGAQLQDGKSLYALGKLDEAEVKFQQLLAIRPGDQGALYYLSLIKQARVMKTVEERQPKPGFYKPIYPLNSTNAAAPSLKVDANIAIPQVTVKVWFMEADANYDGLNAVLTNGFGNSTNGLSPTASGALDEAALQTFLKKLKKNDRVELLNEGEVTTLSGREAYFQLVNIETVVIGRHKTTNATGSSAGYATTNIPVGPMVDLVATVLPDGHSISLIVTPSLITIAGYHESPDMVDYNKPGHPPLQMPVFSTQTATFTTTLQDGQSLVIAGLSDNTETAEPNTAVSPRPFTEKGKQLFIFIRPVIIDGSGNRVHPDEQVHSKDYYDQPIF